MIDGGGIEVILSRAIEVRCGTSKLFEDVKVGPAVLVSDTRSLAASPLWYALTMLPLFLGLVGLMLFIRLVAGAWDHRRIRDDVAGRGGEMREIEWAPMGPGWFADKSSRIYRVTYVDREGELRSAFCKTNALGGVYFTQEDGPAASQGHAHPMPDEAEDPGTDESLQEEVERLRAENEALKRKIGE